MGPASTDILLGLQVFHVLFLALHDWVPLGRLNDIAAVRRVHGVKRMLIGTLISTTPFAFGLVASLYYAPATPHWLIVYLLVAYAFLFMGEIESWWATYFFGYKSGVRAAEYKIMFGKTWSFLPPRHGIVPNTLHVILHTATLATVVLLSAITAASAGP